MSDKENKPLNKIIRDNTGSKKFKVFVKDQSTGNIKTVRFGDPNMKIKRNWILPSQHLSMTSEFYNKNREQERSQVRDRVKNFLLESVLEGCSGVHSFAIDITGNTKKTFS